ncbi:MAG: zf-HC2 domain-containing protein [Chloroflexi bacterium]|nr:zf-HC2 domain-containing protein [Chloroflexota bacterium]
MHVLSTHPDPTELIAHIDGEAAPEVAAHVRHCADCTREAEGLSHTARQLLSKLYRFDCPDSMSLGEYVLDVLDPNRRRRVAAHIVECEECAGELQTLREYLALSPGE